MTHALCTLEHRRAMRGAAMVEALVVIPFFIVVFAALLFVGSLYRTKLRVMRLARESAWTHAMSNCGEAGDPLTSSATPGSDAPGATKLDTGGASPSGADLSLAGQYGRGPHADVATKNMGSARARMQSTLSADPVLGGFARQVSSQTQVLCNEPPYDGALRSFGSAAWHALTNW